MKDIFLKMFKTPQTELLDPEIILSAKTGFRTKRHEKTI